MALQIASDKHKWMVQARDHLEEASIDVEQQATVECISLKGSSLKNFSLSERDWGFVEGAFPKLSILILQKTKYPGGRIPNNFFHCMPNLTYLDFSCSFTSLKELPSEICYLTKLKYLNLSFTHIKSLPQEFGRLENLIYLSLSNTKFLKKVTLKMMPRALEVLHLHRSSLNWEVEGETIFRELKKLQILEGITVQSTSQLQLLSELSHVQIWSIHMFRVNGLASLDIKQSFGGCHLRNHLNHLAISDLSNLTELKVDFREEGDPGMAWNLRKLENLYLAHLVGVEKIIWRGVEPRDFLPRLRTLRIAGCDQLKNVSWVLQLRCLEYIKVKSCRRMTTLIDENEIREGATNLAFPCLRELVLIKLPELEGLFHMGLTSPSLENIFVRDCPKLRTLPFRSPRTNNRIIEIKGSQEWWNGLQWVDTPLHLHFTPSIEKSRTALRGPVSRRYMSYSRRIFISAEELIQMECTNGNLQ